MCQISCRYVGVVKLSKIAQNIIVREITNGAFFFSFTLAGHATTCLDHDRSQTHRLIITKYLSEFFPPPRNAVALWIFGISNPSSVFV